MSKVSAIDSSAYQRAQATVLAKRLREPRRFIQAVAGPRQVGKTTAVLQVIEQLAAPTHFSSADQATLRGTDWIEVQWDAARLLATSGRRASAVLVLDEIQKVTGWSEAVKRLWDEDTRAKRPLKVVLLGSAPLLIAHGLTESLAGRFELLHFPHWSFGEMRDAFGWSLDEYRSSTAAIPGPPHSFGSRRGGRATWPTRSSRRRLAATCC